MGLAPAGLKCFGTNDVAGRLQVLVVLVPPRPTCVRVCVEARRLLALAKLTVPPRLDQLLRIIIRALSVNGVVLSRRRQCPWSY